jgi:DNA-binding NarL/FixJ family response regulator
MIRIVLADDHSIVREGLCLLLDTEQGFQLIGQGSDGHEALRLVEELGPDVLIVDLSMPGLNGLEVTRQVRQRWPHTRVVIFSMYGADAYVAEAFRNGASAYVLKECIASDVLTAIREVAAGGRYLSPRLSGRGLEMYPPLA